MEYSIKDPETFGTPMNGLPFYGAGGRCYMFDSDGKMILLNDEDPEETMS